MKNIPLKSNYGLKKEKMTILRLTPRLNFHDEIWRNPSFAKIPTAKSHELGQWSNLAEFVFSSTVSRFINSKRFYLASNLSNNGQRVNRSIKARKYAAGMLRANNFERMERTARNECFCQIFADLELFRWWFSTLISQLFHLNQQSRWMVCLVSIKLWMDACSRSY